MSPDDALRLAERVGGLFPEATAYQVEFLGNEFAPFDAEVAEEQVALYRRQFESLNLSNLLRRIADAQQRRAGPRPIEAERRAFEAQWERDQARLAAMSDAELEREKAAVLEANPALRSFLADKDPRTSVMLRALILRRGVVNGGA